MLATDSSSLLESWGVTLAFALPDPSPEVHFFGSGPGPDVWKSCKIQGDTAHLSFSSHGGSDGSANPDHCWGVWVLAVPCSVSEERQGTDENQPEELPEPIEGFQEFIEKWVQASQKAMGIPDIPVVDTMGWNEKRLRDLCATHDWEFEWMAEDGERRRRATERRELWRMKDVPNPSALAMGVATPDGTKQLP